jgi:hypothetical protein
LPEAIGLYRQAFNIRQALMDPQARRSRSGSVKTAAAAVSPGSASLENLLTHRDSLAEVEAALKEARVFAETQYSKDGAEVAFHLALTTWVLLEEKKFEEAEATVRECLAIRQKLLPNDWSTHHARHMLGAALAGQNQFGAGETLLVEGYQGMKARPIPSFHRPRVGEAALRIMRFYAELGGRKADVAKWQAEFDSLEPDQKQILAQQPRSAAAPASAR